MLAETRRSSPVFLLSPRTRTDSYGDTVSDWSNPTQTVLPGATIQTRTTADKDINVGTTTERQAVLIVQGQPGGVLSLVTNDSRVMQDDLVWRVNGSPNIKRGLMFGNTHLTATLARTTTEAPNG